MSKLSDNAKYKGYKYRKFWDGLPEVVHSEDHPHDHVDLFKELHPVDPKTGHPISEDKAAKEKLQYWIDKAKGKVDE